MNYSSNIENYKIHEFLGKGTFGEVYKSTYRGEQYAIKILDISRLQQSRAIDRVNTECKIHMSLDHKHIISLKHFFEDSQSVYFIMELAKCSLGDYIKSQASGRCTEYRARIFMAEIIEALRYLHRHDIIHRDVSTGNILLDHSDNIKLADFGLATLQNHQQVNSNFTMCGTPNFIAPEIVNRHGHGTKSDLFSLGCVFYNIVAGKPPFDTKTTRETLQRVRRIQYTMPGGLSVEAENLIRRLLQHDPISRPTLNDIARDPFLQPIVKSKNNLVQSYDSGFGKTFQTASSGATNFLRRSYGDSGVSSVPLKANHKLGNILEENSHSIRKLETLDDSVIEMSTKNEQPMGRRMASMENLHIRQLSEPARSPIKKSSAPLAIPPLNLGVSQSFHKEPADELTRPLSCKRLRPEQNKGSTSRSTLLPNNEGAVLEVLNKKRLISQVMYVTGDGMMVTIGTPKLKVPLEGSETPVSRDQLTSVQRYSFDSLPAKYYKKYKHLRCLCDIIRSKTPKVTLYSKEAKCVLMENANSQISGNFDAKFFTDPKVNIELRYESKQTTRLVFSHKNVCNFEIQASKLSQITPMIVEGYASENAGSENKIDAESYLQRIKHAWIARENAQKLEVSLSETESKMCEFSLFPAIFSMRPSSTDTGQDVTPLSTAPNSARGSNSTKSGNSMSTSVQREIQSTGNTVNQGSLGSIHASDIASFVVSPPQKRDGSLVTRPKRQIGSHRRTKRVPDKGWVTDLGDGNIWCQFEDGSQIEHNLQAKLSTYTDVDGNYKQFASNGTSQNLPPDLRTKMRLSAEMTKYLSK